MSGRERRENRRPRRRGWHRTRGLIWVAAIVAAMWVWYDYANRVRLSRPDESVVATSLELRDLEGRALGESGLIVLGVNVEGLATEQLSRLREEMGIDYRVVVPERAFQGAFEWNGVLPYTWLVDRNGRVRAGHGGLPVERSLRSACEKLLGETG